MVHFLEERLQSLCRVIPQLLGAFCGAGVDHVGEIPRHVAGCQGMIRVDQNQEGVAEVALGIHILLVLLQIRLEGQIVGGGFLQGVRQETDAGILLDGGQGLVLFQLEGDGQVIRGTVVL